MDLAWNLANVAGQGGVKIGPKEVKMRWSVEMELNWGLGSWYGRSC